MKKMAYHLPFPGYCLSKLVDNKHIDKSIEVLGFYSGVARKLPPPSRPEQTMHWSRRLKISANIKNTAITFTIYLIMHCSMISKIYTKHTPGNPQNTKKHNIAS